jgi:hypothetical protein
MGLMVLAVGAGLTWAWAKSGVFRPVSLGSTWLLITGIVLQFLALFVLDTIAASGLVLSQILLALFAWLNRGQPGFAILGIGLVLNLLVIVANGGLMPITPEMVARLNPNAIFQVGERFGASKDIVLPLEATHFWWLSDRFFLSTGITRFAFSIGDVLIAAGAFWAVQSLADSKPQKKELVT